MSHLAHRPRMFWSRRSKSASGRRRRCRRIDSGNRAESAAGARAGHVHERRRADSVAIVRQVPSSRRDRADVADDLRRRASVGAVDEEAGQQARDAAVVPRQDHRHPEVQERSVAERRRDRDDRQVGGRGRSAGQSGRHAPGAEDSRRSSTWRIGKPDLDRAVSRRSRCRRPAPTCTARSTAPFGTTEDRYIKAIQSRVVDANSRKVVHHALSFAVDPDDDSDDGRRLRRRQAGSSSSSTPRARTRRSISTDAGVLLKAGQNARLELSLPLDR